MRGHQGGRNDRLEFELEQRVPTGVKGGRRQHGQEDKKVHGVRPSLAVGKRVC
jgi:hypothetical protein